MPAAFIGHGSPMNAAWNTPYDLRRSQQDGQTMRTSHARTARQEFDRWAGRQQSWGAGLIAVSATLFLWLGYMLLVPFGVHDSRDEIACDAPVFHGSEGAAYSQGAERLCSAERDWPELLTIGLLAVPPAIVGAALFTSGSARKRASSHVFRILEMQESEERARRKTRRNPE
ncbi:hypothetical protein [Streptomyces sp. HB132]|uniref:hypothetical protein n=1 Tax=Streptomyces sp. HB132 TaxID=767388 RepID=UPI001DBCA04B|nr:hypothetical protein [Streptomyces sp. HB132]MBM7439383.1 hypothetical protein [Streptomyces sp. HB132]